MPSDRRQFSFRLDGNACAAFTSRVSLHSGRYRLCLVGEVGKTNCSQRDQGPRGNRAVREAYRPSLAS